MYDEGTLEALLSCPKTQKTAILCVPEFDCSTSTPELYFCPSCGIKMYLKVNLKLHTTIMHKPGSRVTMEKFCHLSDTHYNLNGILKQYNCKNCDFSTFSLLVFLKHVVQHRRKRLSKETPVWKCNYDCLFATTVHRQLDDHIREKHLAPVLVPELHQCDQCPARAVSAKRLADHVLVVHALRREAEWFLCKLCPFRTVHNSSWRLHALLQHSDEQDSRIFHCAHCSYRAKQKKHLQIHLIARHTAPEKVIWFKCEHCHYKARQKCALKAHVVARHTASEEINWFVCELCGFKCKTMGHLKRHMLRHSDSRPMLCEVCSRQFKWLKNLKKHMRTMHGVED